MTIGVGVLTFNVLKTGRAGYLASTLSSIRAAGIEPVVLTNGSVDQTDKLVRECPRGIVDNRNSAMWYGMTRAIEAVLAEDAPSVVVFSADDITYKDGWLERLERFWSAASDEIILAGLFLEDLWNWNQIQRADDIGGERVLIRDSVPSATWSFRARDWPIIADAIPQRSPGEDLETCQKLRALGYELAQLDLATHAGMFQSAWGNRSQDYAKPLNRAEWGFADGTSL